MKTNTNRSRPVLSAKTVNAVAARTERGRTFTPVPAASRTVDAALTDAFLTASQQITPDHKPTALDAVLGRVQRNAEFLENILSRLNLIGDRICGGGHAGDTASERPMSSGLVGDINGSLDDVGALLDRIDAATERLETL